MPSWSNEPKGTMKAAVLSKLGASAMEAFTIDSKYPKPSLPSDTWVLVRVRSAGMSRSDLRARIDEYLVPLEFGIFEAEYQPVSPKVLGEEFVGEVVEAGSKTDFRIGERVGALIHGGGKAYDGAYAEYTICPAERCWHLGEAANDLSWDVLGAIPMSAWTAYGSLFVAGKTKPGMTVFVHGATSAVGVWLILLAKDAGCKVIASTRNPDKVQRLSDAGADHVILEADLVGEQGVRKYVPEGVNVVIELLGISTWAKIGIPALAQNGILVNIGILNLEWEVNMNCTSFAPLRYITCYTLMPDDIELSRKVLPEIVQKVRDGKIESKHFLDKAFALEDVGKAHLHMEENKVVGKIVLMP